MGVKSQVMFPHGDSGGQRLEGCQRYPGPRGAEGRIRDQGETEDGEGSEHTVPGRLSVPIPPSSCRDSQALPRRVKQSRTTPATKVCAAWQGPEKEGEGSAASKAPRGTGVGKASCSPGSLHPWEHREEPRARNRCQLRRDVSPPVSTAPRCNSAQQGRQLMHSQDHLTAGTSFFSHRKVLRQHR